MTFCYSKPVESLIEGKSTCRPLLRARVLIVGSGYGGSIAAYRLAERSNASLPDRDEEVVVLERGKEYSLGEFPNTLGELPGHVGLRRNDRPNAEGNDDALFDFHVGEGVDVLVGSGLGGTSLINANVALRPRDDIFRSGDWPSAIAKEVGDPKSALEKAFKEVTALLEVATEAQLKPLRQLPKYRAFARSAAALQSTPQIAPITVTLPGAAKINKSGVAQNPCTFCGNCVTGCNVGAKNTLAMNAIPRAFARGAKFYTGARVIRISPLPKAPNAPRWAVHVEATSRMTRARCPHTYIIEADTVVLSAGTLGSTEILQRSSLEGAGDFSATLGSRFSTNGDGIAMSFGESEPVQAIGTQEYDKTGQCGPTITGWATTTVIDDTGTSHTFTIEEGAVPASLARLYGELLTTTAQIGRLGDNRLPAAFATGADPLITDPAIIDRGQIFLLMGPDGTRGPDAARGHLKFQNDWDGPERGFTVPVWTPGPKGASQPLERIDTHLSTLDRAPGLGGGQYVPNPAWRLMPEAVGGEMSGKFPGGRLITVHPLGGCTMSDSGRTGVVDHNGGVFVGSSDECHAGLYVLDGAIVPSSLGINPFLTIAALSWRACESIAKELRLGAPSAATRDLPPPPPPPPPPLDRRTELPIDKIIVRERLVGKLKDMQGGPLPADIFPGATRWHGESGFILQLRTDPTGTEQLLTAGKSAVFAELYTNPVSAEDVLRTKIYGSPDAHLAAQHLVAEGAGTIRIMQADVPASRWKRRWRIACALFAYHKRRESLLPVVLKHLFQRGKKKQSVGAAFKSFLDVAKMHATYRDFVYDLKLHPRGDDQLPPIHIVGKKRLAWNVKNPRLWQSLLELKPTVTVPGYNYRAKAELVVDTRFLFGSGLLSTAPDASVPAAIVACIAFVARLARCILQTSFWEFGSPTYPEQPVERRPALPPNLQDGTPVTSYRFNVPKKEVGGPTLTLELHRYGQGRGRVVLLIHGLAQGSLIYAHPAIPKSMADYFSEQDCDVWLLDYRLSNLFTEAQVPFDDWTIDEIGRFDIPLAVAEVLRHYPARTRLHIFAHCVGAIGTTMAILGKHIDSSQIASLALNAIHPWTMPSPANIARAKLGVFYRDLVGDDFFDPIMPTAGDVTVVQSLYDRLAFSLARIREGDDAHARKDATHIADAICDRMTALYGRMWQSSKVEDIHSEWQHLVGRSPSAVQRHLHYIITQERVLDHEGLNCYLKEDNFTGWRGIRTLFIHGEESRVFNPQSATRSAIRMRRVLNRNPQTGMSADAHVPSTPIGLRRVPGFGHMDVILGKGAVAESFQYVDEFFLGHFDNGALVSNTYRQLTLDCIDPEDDPHGTETLQPATGPIMRAARIKDGILWVRYWLERPNMNTTLVSDIEIHPNPKMPPIEFCDIELGDDYRWLDVAYDPKTYPELQTQLMARSAFNLSWLPRLIERSTDSGLAQDCYFLVASCLYPGTPFDREMGSRIFIGMQQLLDRGEDCDLLFMIGDQIYADATAGLLDPISWRDRYTARYREAFNGEAIRTVLSRIPCHFTVDDHEFADGYMGIVPRHERSTYKGWHENTPAHGMSSGEIDADQFSFARRTARAYQASGRDLRCFGNEERPAGGALWYALDHDSEIRCPAFVLDTRSERVRASSTHGARLMGDTQLEALLKWLDTVGTRPQPKFIFSGVAIAPMTRETKHAGMWLRQDGLAGYPDELESIIAHIIERNIQKVVFVAGDLHLSSTVELTLSNRKGKVAALQIVASGLYAPLPFANLDARQIEWGASHRIVVGSSRVDYVPKRLASDCAHFVRVGASNEGAGCWGIEVEAYDHEGKRFAHAKSWL